MQTIVARLDANENRGLNTFLIGCSRPQAYTANCSTHRFKKGKVDLMSRSTTLFVAAAAAFFAAQSAHADFLIGDYNYASLVHNNGSPAVTMTGGPAVPPESYDGFVPSGDGKHIFRFGNNLGFITALSWNATTGAYEGLAGPDYGYSTLSPPWPANISPTVTMGAERTRATYPAFAGDLLYVGRTFPTAENGFSDRPLINVINSTTRQYTEQIIPPAAVTQIHNFALGPGTLGPMSRAYLSTNAGLLVYDESDSPVFIGIDPITHLPVFDPNGFRLVSSTPLPITLSVNASFDVGPDGLLYALDGAGSASSIKRYNTSSGALVDTFLTFAEYNYGGIVGYNLKFGPDGGLYFSSSSFSPPLYHTVVTRFDVSTRQRTDFDLGNVQISNFYVLPVPEPSALSIMLISSLLLARLTRRC